MEGAVPGLEVLQVRTAGGAELVPEAAAQHDPLEAQGREAAESTGACTRQVEVHSPAAADVEHGGAVTLEAEADPPTAVRSPPVTVDVPGVGDVQLERAQMGEQVAAVAAVVREEVIREVLEFGPLLWLAPHPYRACRGSLMLRPGTPAGRR